MSRSPKIVPVADESQAPEGPRPYFLLIDDRFRVPIFVFVEVDPRGPGTAPGRTVRPVTLEFVPIERAPRRCWVGIRPGSAIGRSPEHWEQFREFASDGHARAAGFLPIEPRYVGPSWESYLGAFRPEGERPVKRHASAVTG